MAKIELIPQWTVILTTKELRLITQALTGRPWKDELQQAEARELGRRLGKMRAASTKVVLDQADKLLTNIETEGVAE